MRTERRGPWVVYLQTLPGRTDTVRAVCDQAEWDAMERDNPGTTRTLVRGGITSEGEAEMLARGTSGDKSAAASKRKKPAAAPEDGPTPAPAPGG